MYVNESKDFLTVSRVMLALRRCRLQIAVCTTIGTLVTIALLVSLPNVYQSTSILYIKMGRGTVGIDPATSASGSHIALMDSRQTEINSVKEMLTSRIVMEGAVNAVGVERVMSHMPWFEMAAKSSKSWLKEQGDWLKASVSGRSIEEVQQEFEDLPASEVVELETLEEAVERVQNKFSVHSTKDSYTLRLTCSAYSPKLARDLCQAIVDEYRMVHVEAHSVRGSLAFFEHQYDESVDRLLVLENELRDTKNRSQMMTIPGKQELVLAEIKQLQTDLLKVSSEVAGARARDVELVSKFEAMPERVMLEQTAGVANDASDKMRNQLFELEMLEKDLTNRYTSEHPLVTQVREKLISAKRIYESQDTDRTHINEAINPTRQALELDRLRNLSTLEGFKAQQQDLLAKISAAQEKAEQVNSDEVLLNSLERQVSLARADVMNYGHKQEEARLLDQLDSANLTDVSLPQPPSLVVEKVGPKRALLAMAGAISFWLASCVLAVFIDLRKEQQATERALAGTLDISKPADRSPIDAKPPRLVEKDIESLSETTSQRSSPWMDN